MSTRVHILQRIIAYIHIQVSSVTKVRIFLCESADCGIIPSCSQIIEPCYFIVLFSCIKETAECGICLCQYTFFIQALNISQRAKSIICIGFCICVYIIFYCFYISFCIIFVFNTSICSVFFY